MPRILPLALSTSTPPRLLLSCSSNLNTTSLIARKRGMLAGGTYTEKTSFTVTTCVTQRSAFARLCATSSISSPISTGVSSKMASQTSCSDSSSPPIASACASTCSTAMLYTGCRKSSFAGISLPAGNTTDTCPPVHGTVFLSVRMRPRRASTTMPKPR